MAGTGEPVFDEAATRLAGRDQVADQRLAVGVLEIDLVLAFHGLVAAMNEIDAVGIEAEIVVVAGVTQAAQGIAGSQFGIVLGQLAFGEQLVMVADDANAYFDDVAHFFLAILQHRALELEECRHAQYEQADQGQANEKLHAGGEFESGQGAHESSSLY